MKQLRFLLVAMMAVIAMTATADVNDTFTAQATLNGTGSVEMTFKVLTEEEGNYTVQVGNNACSINSATAGELVVPGEVTYNEHTYVVTKIGNSAFTYCNQITAIELPSEITEIGNSAFFGCNKLARLNIPDKVVTIGQNVFFSTLQLKSLTLPESLTTINYGGFNACGITSIRIPKNVTSIGETAFSQCQSLTSIVVDEANTTFDSRDNCNAIIQTSSNKLLFGCAGTTIPNTVTTIGKYAFYNVSITSLTIPESVTAIEEAGINFCQRLTSLHISKNVTSIAPRTCNSCILLNSLTVDPENPVYDSRDNCNGIIQTATNTLVAACMSTVIPATVTVIGERAYSGFRASKVVLPDNIITIANAAFFSSDITSMDIPSSVTTIGQNAFSQCSNLESVTIPASVSTIGQSAFGYCSKLKTVVVGHQVPLEHVGQYCFTDSYLSQMTLHVPAGTKSAYEQVVPWKNFGTIVEEEPILFLEFTDANVKAICVANWDTDGDGEISRQEAAAVTNLGTVFKSNTTITSFDELQYFTSLTTLASEAFSGCSKLASVVFPESLQQIYSKAFYSCNSLQTPTFTANLTQLQDQCFAFCTAFENLTIPSTITYCNHAFAGCSGLETITVSADNQYYSSPNGCNALLNKAGTTLYLGCENTVVPNTVTTISINAFYGCSIETLTLPEGLTTISGSAFANCSKLKSINLPAGITTIPRMAFNGCASLTSIQLPDNLTSIVEYAFYGCGLVELSLPEFVTSIGNSAFYGCNSLRKVTVNRQEPVTISEYTFSTQTYNNAILRVPTGSLTPYATATGWKNFKLIYDTDVPLRGDINGDGEVTIADVTELVNIILEKQ